MTNRPRRVPDSNRRSDPGLPGRATTPSADPTPGSRAETDTMGSVRVPGDRLWGAQTQRSLEYFAIGDERMPRALVHAYGIIKAAAAQANHECGSLPADLAHAIEVSAGVLALGDLDDEVPVRLYTTGSGTHLNANVNEVVANHANGRLGHALGSKSPIHPNDHVNLSQSSNDTFLTAMHMALLDALDRTEAGVDALIAELDAKASEWEPLRKTARTHLMDATPMSAGAEWRALSASVRRALEGTMRARDELLEVPLGGTAIGDGIAAAPGFRDAAIAALGARSGRDFRAPRDPLAAQSTIEAVAEAHGALKSLASALFKVGNDLRWMASGPRGGLAELTIPANEPGSTVMPGKVNPTQAEALLMACVRVLGNDVSVAICASEGNFQLNAFRPLAIAAALESAQLLGDASASIATNLVRGARLNPATLERALDSPMILTALSPRLGYERTARIIARAEEEGLSAREAALADGVDPQVVDSVLA